MKKYLFIFNFLTILIIQSCSMVKISVSEKRKLISHKIELDNNILVTTWGAIKVNKSHFFPSSFQIKANDKIIYIDPIEIDSSDSADYILLTHAHPDHLSIKDIKKITDSETIIICSQRVTKKLSVFNNVIHTVRPGDIINFEDFQCEAIPAYNTKPVFLWIKAHPKSKENVGFVITLDEKIRIYHAGDTDYIPEMTQLKNIHVALIPIGGDNLTMNADEASLIINKIKPEKVIPMHFEINDIDFINRLKKQVDKSIVIEEIP